MNRIKIGNYILEIDREKTLSFYEKHPLISEECNCMNCKNYVKACINYPKEVLELFNTLGIIPTKEAEVYNMCKNEDGTHLYGGFYHIAGRIVDGEDFWNQKSRGYEDMCLISENFYFAFTKDISLLPTNFPEPVLQMEFITNIPWVLDEG